MSGEHNLKTVVYIIGSGHCGSTLLDRLLAAHPEVFGGGELEALNVSKVQATLSEPWPSILKKYSVTQPLEVARSKMTTLLNSEKYIRTRTGEKVEKEAIARETRELYELIAEETGCPVVVDSSKDVARAECVGEINDINIVFVHLLRDPRGVTWSYYKKYPDHIFFVCTAWLFSLMKTRLFLRRTKRERTTVFYEDLVTDPDNVLNELFEKIGLEPLNNPLQKANQSPATQVRGNRMKNKEIVLQEDKSWIKAPKWLLTIATITSSPVYYIVHKTNRR